MKSAPRFLGLNAALKIHHDQIAAFGGSHGIRGQSLLESALGQAQSTYLYTNDLIDAAAQYCISIARNHAFVDGNKRTAAACMLTFLVLNGIEPTLNSAQLFDWTMRVAIGKLDRAGLGRLLRQHSKRLVRRKR